MKEIRYRLNPDFFNELNEKSHAYLMKESIIKYINELPEDVLKQFFKFDIVTDITQTSLETRLTCPYLDYFKPEPMERFYHNGVEIFSRWIPYNKYFTLNEIRLYIIMKEGKFIEIENNLNEKFIIDIREISEKEFRSSNSVFGKEIYITYIIVEKLS